MRPINRIPLEADAPPLHAIVKGELGTDTPSALNELVALIHYSKDDDSINTTLDWAMQIRDELGIDWASAIRVAGIMYYG